jgi:YHS domain-containing protein
MKTFLMLLMTVILGACSHGGKGGHHGKDHKCNCDKKAEVKPVAVEFDSNCAMGLCRKGAKVKCDPTITAAYQGKNYCFSSEEARETFMKDIDGNLKKSNRAWDALNRAPGKS